MIRRLLMWITSRLPVLVITDHGKPYLELWNQRAGQSHGEAQK